MKNNRKNKEQTNRSYTLYFKPDSDSDALSRYQIISRALEDEFGEYFTGSGIYLGVGFLHGAFDVSFTCPPSVVKSITKYLKSTLNTNKKLFRIEENQDPALEGVDGGWGV